ncbi:E3 ubiquitin-protein ligase SH3RF1-like [Ictidomys tridecemlineatus]|uniref:E3 ubiquitin-protein ligase SH3RF1-like n=1 Tax=Ictidomys tridecemlineatus TaxID=43179 RepID=UPI000B53B8A3|nr:E3 ubiquitin-protein ligase SH3RF1-like [Ictidomys tridecemlineatus]KAG3257899.1 E3 ubiquitin-protein ligase SH3RF1-like [Ictidomys tridecemlineatus]
MGSMAFFTTNLVQIIKPLSQPPPQCKALYAFEVKNKKVADNDCLLSVKDDVLTVIQRMDVSCAERMLEDKIAIFLISYIEFNLAAKQLTEWDKPPMPVVDAETCTSAAAQSSSALKHSNTKNNTKKHPSLSSPWQTSPLMHPRTVSPWRSALLSSSDPATFSCHKDQRTVCAFLQCPFSDSRAHGTMNPPFPVPALLAAIVFTSILPGAMPLLLEWVPVSWQNPLLTDEKIEYYEDVNSPLIYLQI